MNLLTLLRGNGRKSAGNEAAEQQKPHSEPARASRIPDEPRVIEMVGRTLVEGLATVYRMQPPNSSYESWGWSIEAGKVKLTNRWFDTGITVPFAGNDDHIVKLEQGLAELLGAEPGLTGRVSVVLGEDPEVEVDYANQPGMLFADVEMKLGIFGMWTIKGRTYDFRNSHHEGYNLRNVLGALGKEEADDTASQALMNRLMVSAISRGVPVTATGDATILFGQGQVVWNIATLQTELRQKPAKVILEGYKTILERVIIGTDDLTINMNLGAESIEANKAMIGLAVNAASTMTGVNLITELQRPWKVTYSIQPVDSYD